MPNRSVHLSACTPFFLAALSACSSPPKPAPVASTSSVASTRPSVPDSAERVARVERGLLPPVRFKDETASWSLEERMRVHRVPGLVIAVFEDYRLAWTKAYGVADVTTGERLTETSLMQCGSTSKSVAALVALEEVRAGKLSLDAGINTLLTSWKLPENDLTRRVPVTLRRLLSHTAGTNQHGFWGYAPGEPLPTLVQVLDGKPPANSGSVVVDLLPGSQFRYSGGGILIAQQAVIDAEGGRPYPVIAAERVLGPLGMTHSTYEQPLPAARLASASAGHMVGRIIPGKRHAFTEMAAGGLWTTASDLSRFFIEIQLGLAGRGALVTREMASLMTTPVADAWPGARVAPGTFVWKEGDAEYFGHGGTNEGFQSVEFARKGKGYGAVIMANSVGSERLFGEVRRAIAAAYAWDGYGEPPLERKPVDVQKFAAFEGRWALDRGRGFSLSVRAGRLEMRPAMEDAEELVPVGDASFIGRDTGVRVTLEANGVVIEQRQPYAGPAKLAAPERASRVTDPAAAPIFLLEEDRFGDAVAAYRKLLEANPKDPVATEDNLGRLASWLYRTPHDAAVLRIYRLISELYPHSTDAQEYFGDVLALNGQRAAAIDAYNRAIAVKNRDKKAAAEDKARFAAFIARKIGRMPRT